MIHFWADWSEPCKQMQEAMEDLAREHSNVKFYKVDHTSALYLCDDDWVGNSDISPSTS